MGKGLMAKPSQSGGIGGFAYDPYKTITGGKDKQSQDANQNAVNAAGGYDPSAGASNVAFDPQGYAAQQQALQALQGRVSAGGLDAQDQARIGDINRNSQIQEQGQRQALVSAAARHGQAGSGSAFAAQLANQQGQANRLSQQGMDTASLAQQSRLQAVQQLGQLGGSVNTQNMQLGQAQDAKDIFNAQGRADKAGKQIGAYQGQAKGYSDQAQRRLGVFGAATSGAGQAGSSIASSLLPMIAAL